MKYASVSSEEMYVLLKIYAERWVSGMVGFGTMINVAAIVAGGCAGLVFGGRLTERCQETLIKTIGAAVVFIGVGGTLQQRLHLFGHSGRDISGDNHAAGWSPESNHYGCSNVQSFVCWEHHDIPGRSQSVV